MILVTGQFAVACVSAYLNEVLALGLGDERLKLRGGERIHKAGL